MKFLQQLSFYNYLYNNWIGWLHGKSEDNFYKGCYLYGTTFTVACLENAMFASYIVLFGIL